MRSLTDARVDEVKSQWKRRARYEKLFVEKGTVLFATRNFKVLTLREILELHKVENAERLGSADLHLGGLGQVYSCKHHQRQFTQTVKKTPVCLGDGEALPALEDGRGWLHV